MSRKQLAKEFSCVFKEIYLQQKVSFQMDIVQQIINSCALIIHHVQQSLKIRKHMISIQMLKIPNMVTLDGYIQAGCCNEAQHCGYNFAFQWGELLIHDLYSRFPYLTEYSLKTVSCSIFILGVSDRIAKLFLHIIPGLRSTRKDCEGRQFYKKALNLTSHKNDFRVPRKNTTAHWREENVIALTNRVRKYAFEVWKLFLSPSDNFLSAEDVFSARHVLHLRLIWLIQCIINSAILSWSTQRGLFPIKFFFRIAL